MNTKLINLLIIVALMPCVAAASVNKLGTDISSITPVTDKDLYRNGKFPQDQITLGQKLFFDKIISGNKNISCATCHHPRLGTTDAIALSIGEGGVGLGRKRRVPDREAGKGRVPRNSQALYFVGAKEYSRLFHDGRVEKDQYSNWKSGFWSPAREQLPAGLDNVLAVQAMFPVTSDVEMAGQKGENAVADAVALKEFTKAWHVLAGRLQKVPEYVELFKSAYPHIQNARDIQFVDAANAIAAFETVMFRADNSPFDQYLRTRNKDHLSVEAQRGMKLFYGRGKCSHCHSGKFQSDQKFHSIAMPQIGPGKKDGWDQSYWQSTGFMARLEDYGRARVTLRDEDKFRFRTPSLRNVELTAPYGHAGAYNTLHEVVRHHTNPAAALENYDVGAAILPAISNIIETTAIGSQLIYSPVNPVRLVEYRKRDTWVMQTKVLRRAISRANELPAIALDNYEIDDLVAFLKSLTDPHSLDFASFIPESVPSGLSIDN